MAATLTGLKKLVSTDNNLNVLGRRCRQDLIFTSTAEIPAPTSTSVATPSGASLSDFLSSETFSVEADADGAGCRNSHLARWQRPRRKN